MSDYKSAAAAVALEPDYTNLLIPPNIAPMNFTIREAGQKYFIKIYASTNDTIRISCVSPHVKIPLAPWRDLLSRNIGKRLYFDVFVHTDEGKWVKYHQIANRIAEEPIDRYLVYRFLRPNYTIQKEMNIRQRDLTSYDESLLMTSKTIAACINCHSFNIVLGLLGREVLKIHLSKPKRHATLYHSCL